MLDKSINKKIYVEAIKASLLEALMYFAMGGLVTYFVMEGKQPDELPFLGIWNFPLVGLLCFGAVFYLKYMTNINAHKKLQSINKVEYEKELSLQLEGKSLRELLKTEWFLDTLKDVEKHSS
jgi:hypothetical protein